MRKASAEKPLERIRRPRMTPPQSTENAMSTAAATATAETAAPPAVPPTVKPDESRIRVVRSSPSPLAGAGRGAGASEKSPTPPIDPEKLAALEEASIKLLGQVTWLLSLSPAHKHMFMADLEWRIRPAVALRQCRLFLDKGRPMGFVTWAYVSEEVAGRLQAMPNRLQPPEWRSGKRLMIMDVVAPFGGGADLAQEVVKQHKLARIPNDIATNDQASPVVSAD